MLITFDSRAGNNASQGEANCSVYRLVGVSWRGGCTACPEGSQARHSSAAPSSSVRDPAGSEQAPGGGQQGQDEAGSPGRQCSPSPSLPILPHCPFSLAPPRSATALDTGGKKCQARKTSEANELLPSLRCCFSLREETALQRTGKTKTPPQSLCFVNHCTCGMPASGRSEGRMARCFVIVRPCSLASQMNVTFTDTQNQCRPISQNL